MVFSSILFLFYFLPFTLFMYFIVPKTYRNLVLLLCSIFFYAWGEPKYIWIMFFSIVLDYVCGRMMHYSKASGKLAAAKLWVGVSLVGNLGLLTFFKYADFLIGNINFLFGQQLPLVNLALPIGISFYTFQTMSYSLDVYRGEAPVQPNLIAFGTYVTLFPQLIAGPIVRYQTVAEELESRQESYVLFWSGTKRFILGLGKKVLLANNIGLLWDFVSRSDLQTLPVLSAWLGILAFALQIYFDFSGYSDMAIGLGRMFGFHFLENFNYPYLSQSITDFWRRWHISLGTWFKEYVYIPLGGNQKGKRKQARNILLVWFLTGIWHGASWNFAVWGMYFGILLLLEKFFLLAWLERMPAWIRRIYTLFFVLLSWVIFAFESFSDGLLFLSRMFAFHGVLYDSASLYFLYTNALLFFLSFLAATDLPKKFWLEFSAKKHSASWLPAAAENTFLFLMLLLSTAYLVDQSYNPFLYFRF